MRIRERSIFTKKTTLIIDISCDAGLGFEFAKPTSFNKPIFKVANKIFSYAVDHTPSYSWYSASYELSKVIIPQIETVIKGPEAWSNSLTISKAIDIDQGIILNEKIISYQKRDSKYPYHKILSQTPKRAALQKQILN
jgi:alanine dehydrogenase